MKNLLVVSILIAQLVVGCAILQPGADPLVVRAEQTQQVSLAVVDQFLRYEYKNRATLGPKVKQAADEVRKNFPPASKALEAATKAYKNNRTIDNKANLITWLSVVETLQGEVSAWFPLNPQPVQ